MRTLIIIVAGLIVLAAFLLIARLTGGAAHRSRATAAKVFIPLWLVAAGVNMWMGVQAGYSVAEELPIFLLIFAVPAAAAVFFWRKFSRAATS